MSIFLLIDLGQALYCADRRIFVWRPPRLFFAVSIRIDYADWQIVMRLCQFPAAVLFASKRGMVREKLFGNLGAMTGGGLILVRNHDAVFPSSVFARMKSWII